MICQSKDSHKTHRKANSASVWAGSGKYRIRFALTRWQWRCLEAAAALNHASKMEERKAA
jgi:hypothetical protein